VLGHQIGVLAQPVAGAFDLNDDGMVEQPVEHAVATTGSPNTSPHSAKPWLEVGIIAPFS
jgi:hypothetical protein